MHWKLASRSHATCVCVGSITRKELKHKQSSGHRMTHSLPPTEKSKRQRGAQPNNQTSQSVFYHRGLDEKQPHSQMPDPQISHKALPCFQANHMHVFMGVSHSTSVLCQVMDFKNSFDFFNLNVVLVLRIMGSINIL